MLYLWARTSYKEIWRLRFLSLLRFEKFYAERRKIRIFFKNILVALYLTVYEGWGHTHFRKNFSLLLVSIPTWAFWFPAENQVIRPGAIIQSYPARAFTFEFLGPRNKFHG